jgi:hypothetical protein
VVTRDVLVFDELAMAVVRLRHIDESRMPVTSDLFGVAAIRGGSLQ